MLGPYIPERSSFLIGDAHFIQHLAVSIHILSFFDQLHERQEDLIRHGRDFQKEMSIHKDLIRIYILRDLSPIHSSCIVRYKRTMLRILSAEWFHFCIIRPFILQS